MLRLKGLREKGAAASSGSGEGVQASCAERKKRPTPAFKFVEERLARECEIQLGLACGEPKWELLVHTPAVFVRVANKGVAGYGTWKNIRRMGDEGSSGGRSKGEKGCRAKRTDSSGLKISARVACDYQRLC